MAAETIQTDILKTTGPKNLGNEQDILDLFQAGKIDFSTLLALIPENNLPRSILEAHRTSIKNSPVDEGQKLHDKNEREGAERLGEMIEQWRVLRGAEYVEAYTEFKQTGEAVDAGKRVFEGDWFQNLQASRAKTIQRLEEKAATGALASSEQETLKKARAEFTGDKMVSENWKKISDDYREILAKEKTGSMSASEIREKEAEIKQKMFDELDSASPELRDKLLEELEKHDPSIRATYHEHFIKTGSASQPVIPNSPAVSSELAEVSAAGDLDAGIFDEYKNGNAGIIASVAPKHDFNKATVQSQTTPAAAAGNVYNSETEYRAPKNQGPQV